jgi:putative tricarboxylic transport membrane protein
MHRIKDMNVLLTGVFLILVALLAFYLAAPLSSKTDVGLGPGYVPKMFAFMQLGLGALMIFNAFVQEGVASEPWHLRPLLLILASVGFFAVSIERLGLIVAVTGLVLISCAANHGTTWREALVLAVSSAAVSALLFVKLLGLTIPIWPPTLWGS